MNSPENSPIDVFEQREWLLEHKRNSALSWTALAAQTGIATGTISVFASGKYAGDNERVARDIFRFRQHVSTQAELAVEAPEIPAYFDCPTSRRLQALLTWAQRGRMVVAVTGPGCSKTISIANYRDSMSNVWLITGKPSCSGVNNMQIEVLAALGERNARGTTQDLSRRIRERIRNSGGLLAFDEAQHFSIRALDEIRSWHDETAVGVAFFGNEEVLANIDGSGRRRAAFAQLNSRISMRHVQQMPLISDARALADAWEVADEKQVEFIVKRSQEWGGLRTITMMLELATMIAAGGQRERELGDLHEAWAQLKTRPMAAA